MESRKMGLMNLSEGSRGDADTQNTVGRRGWDELKTVARKHVLSYVTLDKPAEICYMTSGAKSVLCDSLEGRDVVGSGREVQEGGAVCIPTADSCGYIAETDTVL